jgi:hypothetical protein
VTYGASINCCLWTLAILAIIGTMLKREKGIELSKSGVSRLRGDLGLSPQRRIYRSYRQNPKELERHLKRTFPKLRELAKRTGAVIYFVDEVSVRSDAHRETTPGKIGQTPVVAKSGDRFGLRLISAVSPSGDMRFATFQGRMNGVRFVQFLKDASRHRQANHRDRRQRQLPPRSLNWRATRYAASA